MAYRRNFRGRRRFRRGRKVSWYNRKYSTLQLAKKAFRGVRYLRGLVNSEMLYTERQTSLGSMQANIWNLCQVPEGDDYNQRHGNSILVRTLYLRGFMQVNPSVTGDSRVSLVIVQDKQQIADTVPAITDIFTGITPESMVKLASAGRFKIIWRKNYTLNIPAGNTPNHNISKFFNLYSHVRFNGAADSDGQKNVYYLVMLTSEATNFPSISISTRLGFHDN